MCVMQCLCSYPDQACELLRLPLDTPMMHSGRPMAFSSSSMGFLHPGVQSPSVMSLRLVALLRCSQADRRCSSQRLKHTDVIYSSLACAHADEDSGLDEAEFTNEALESGGDDMQPEEEGPVRALLGVQTADDEEQPEAAEDLSPERFADAEQPDIMADDQLEGDEVAAAVRRKTVALVTAVFSIAQCEEPAGHVRQAARKMPPTWIRSA